MGLRGKWRWMLRLNMAFDILSYMLYMPGRLRRYGHIRGVVAGLFCAACLFYVFPAAAEPPASAAGTVKAVKKTFSVRLRAYARVEPSLGWKLLPPKGCPPASKELLWLKASFYGTDINSLRAGLAGSFAPERGGAPVKVRVCSVFDLLEPDGGRAVAMVAVGTSPGWLSGQLGAVTLKGPSRTLAAVPTRALVLDRGRWWVLVRTPKANVPRAVVPGPSRGWLTFIESGLSPGEEVVADDAYLEFHRNIAGSYQPPD